MKKLMSTLSILMVLASFTFMVHAHDSSIEIHGNSFAPYFVLNGNYVFCAEPYKQHPDNGTKYAACESTNGNYEKLSPAFSAFEKMEKTEKNCQTMQLAIWAIVDSTTDYQKFVKSFVGTEYLPLFNDLVKATASKGIKVVAYESSITSFQVMVGYAIVAPETTTKAPETTTMAPETTTKIPETTTKVSETTTKVSETTTKVSETTVKLPVTETTPVKLVAAMPETIPTTVAETTTNTAVKVLGDSYGSTTTPKTDDVIVLGESYSPDTGIHVSVELVATMAILFLIAEVVVAKKSKI